MLNDALLLNYVDEVFMIYDRDRSGSLQPTELANFFNDVFEKMHNPSRFTIQQANQALRQIDANFDGRASKKELFDTLKILMSSSNPSYNQNSYGYTVHSAGQSSQNQGAYGTSYQNNSSNIKSSPTYSYQTSPSTYLDANYAETSRILQPNSLIPNQPTVTPVSVITSTTVSDPGYMKITTTTGPGGYTKVTTESYSTSTTYKY